MDANHFKFGKSKYIHLGTKELNDYLLISNY